MLFHRAAVDFSRSTWKYVAGVIRRHRRSIRSRWRVLSPSQQALLVLVHLRKGETFAELAAGFGISTATAWRYVEETVMLLSARSPKLSQALGKAKDEQAYLVLDGTLIRTDRVAADRPCFSGKHRVHGMGIQVIAGADGSIIWVSGAVPGSVHDLSAARMWGIPRALAATGRITLADKGYQGTNELITPYKGTNKPKSQKQANRSHAALRAPGERANPQIKSWKLLHRLRCSPSKAGHLCKAVHVLQTREATAG